VDVEHKVRGLASTIVPSHVRSSRRLDAALFADATISLRVMHKDGLRELSQRTVLNMTGQSDAEH